jgi:hypothetical protein
MKLGPLDVPSGYCGARVGAMRRLKLSTVAAVCALDTVICFVVAGVAMGSRGVGVLIPWASSRYWVSTTLFAWLGR